MNGYLNFDSWRDTLRMIKECECTPPKDYGIYLSSKRKKKKKKR